MGIAALNRVDRKRIDTALIPGTVLRVKRNPLSVVAYYHAGAYIGGDKIVHVTRGGSGDNVSQTSVRKS
jgi:cell wall-associated NlpC family hydrolase